MSRQFWGGDIGLPVVSDKGSVVFFRLPGAGNNLVVVKEGVSAATDPPVCALNAGKDTVMVCLLTTDVDGWIERCAARGHLIAQPAMNLPKFGIRNALLRSPEGYLVEIQQFLDPVEHSQFIV